MAFINHNNNNNNNNSLFHYNLKHECFYVDNSIEIWEITCFTRRNDI